MQLVRQHGDRLFAVAYRIVRDADRAREALQEAFMLAWRDIPTLRDPDRFEQWLQRIVTNVCIAQASSERRRSAGVGRLDQSPAADDIVAVDDRDQLDRGFARLKPNERAVLVLHHYLGYSPAEIANVLGLPQGTARSRLHHAHRAMRAALEAEARVAVAGRETA
jgi:RNA polymerase sigma-70 factor (ECF subfamily)